ncbi:MAG: proline dehydrogenase family protein [Pyrinomonadaceae bacterium]
MSDFQLDLNNTAVAFASKSNAELKKKYWLFFLMGSPLLTNIGTKSAELGLSLGLPIKFFIKQTIFRQFCGGETIAECEPTIQDLGRSNIGTILDYSVEGKSDETVFEFTKAEILRTIERADADRNVPFAVFKTTGVARFELLEKVSANQNLSGAEQIEWQTAKSRVHEICETAYKLKQPVFIDAEESWIQDAIDALAAEMMQAYNRAEPIIYNTIQLYRHDRLDFLKKSSQAAAANNYFLGAKLVRGAYMEKERARAAELNYPSPIQPDKESADRDYNDALHFCIDNIESISFVAGTHNEESVQLLARLMHERDLPSDHPHIYFSQLYGMSDNLSYVLAKEGYNVSKYVPYGPVKDALPYLIRRARENTSVMGQMSRELDLISQEITRRKRPQPQPLPIRTQENENVLPEMRKR